MLSKVLLMTLLDNVEEDIVVIKDRIVTHDLDALNTCCKMFELRCHIIKALDEPRVFRGKEDKP